MCAHTLRGPGISAEPFSTDCYHSLARILVRGQSHQIVLYSVSVAAKKDSAVGYQFPHDVSKIPDVRTGNQWHAGGDGVQWSLGSGIWRQSFPQKCDSPKANKLPKLAHSVDQSHVEIFI
jgi:hypothetical protein